MLHISPIAKAELRAMLGRFAPEGSSRGSMGFRIVSTPGEQGSLSLALDHPTSEDEIHSHERRKVLLLDRTTSERLDGFTLDLADTPEGNKLTLH
jgi:hypothetical protein